MIQNMLPDLDLNELREFPNLWKSHLKLQEQAAAEGKAEGERTKARADILEVIATRFNPPVADYQQIETALRLIADIERLNVLFTRSLKAADVAEFAAGLSE
jgi:hypothetical protein